jgi:hypothetical protein
MSNWIKAFLESPEHTKMLKIEIRKRKARAKKKKVVARYNIENDFNDIPITYLQEVNRGNSTNNSETIRRYDDNIIALGINNTLISNFQKGIPKCIKTNGKFA